MNVSKRWVTFLFMTTKLLIMTSSDFSWVGRSMALIEVCIRICGKKAWAFVIGISCVHRAQLTDKLVHSRPTVDDAARTAKEPMLFVRMHALPWEERRDRGGPEAGTGRPCDRIIYTAHCLCAAQMHCEQLIANSTLYMDFINVSWTLLDPQ